MATSKIYTLWDLLTDDVEAFEDKIPFGIEIPMIQRDYAQGRDTEKPTLIREKFLRDIHNQLLAFQNEEQLAEPLEMDFIYGYVSSGKFVPLDGQQRLTTLYLIHWFIFFKNRTLMDHLAVFDKLSYKSRVSTRDFFEKINQRSNLERLYLEIDLVEQNGNQWDLTSIIPNQSWFQAKWMNDPTIQSVMRMFTDISKLFDNISSETLLKHRPLGFYLMDIPNNGMEDSLYIKMNARGKGLTDFENSKAILEGRINSVDTDLHIDFSKGIDQRWLDEVWLFGNHIVDTEDRSKAAGAYLLGLITCITELLFYKDAVEKILYNFNEETLLGVYSDRENIVFLVNVMEHICSLGLGNYDDYFTQIYSENINEGRVRHYGKPNMIEQVLQCGSIENPDKLLFFAWLIYVNNTNQTDVTSNMKDYLRLCRNYINNINQKSRKLFSLTSEIRTEDFGDILDVFVAVLNPLDVYGNLTSSKVADRTYIRYEIKKAERFAFDSRLKPLIQRFEDNDVFRGVIFNVDLERYGADELAYIVEDFSSLLDMKDDHRIIRLFISLGYEGTMIAHTNIGDMMFWGGKNKWHRVMASPDREIKPVLALLFKLLVDRDRSVPMVDFVQAQCEADYLNTEQGSLKWYLLQYKQMLSKPLYTITERAWKVPMVEIFDISSLNGYHCNPFVFVLREMSEIKSLLKYNDCYSQYSEYAWLELINGIGLSQANDSWVLHRGIGRASFYELVSRFDLEDIGENRFRFRCSDLIKDIIPFVQACAELGEIEVVQEVMEE